MAHSRKLIAPIVAAMTMPGTGQSRALGIAASAKNRTSSPRRLAPAGARHGSYSWPGTEDQTRLPKVVRRPVGDRGGGVRETISSASENGIVNSQPLSRSFDQITWARRAS